MDAGMAGETVMFTDDVSVASRAASSCDGIRQLCASDELTEIRNVHAV
jgi:hypothetical protein